MNQESALSNPLNDITGVGLENYTFEQVESIAQCLLLGIILTTDWIKGLFNEWVNESDNGELSIAFSWTDYKSIFPGLGYLEIDGICDYLDSIESNSKDIAPILFANAYEIVNLGKFWASERLGAK